MSADFHVELIQNGREAVVRLTGELDEPNAAQASAKVDEALARGPSILVIELSGLRFMDSTGIWLLVETDRRCLAQNVELRLAGGRQPEVAQVLSLSGVDQMVGNGRAAASTPAYRVRLRLYVSPRSATSRAAERSLEAMRAELGDATIDVEIVDVFEKPELAQADRVIATPTLIKLEPEPQLRVIGAVEDARAVMRHLGLEESTA